MTAKRRQHGLALMDLLLGLMIGSIVLAAAAAMADAMSHGKRATEQMTRTSNYLAQVHTRLSDLIMRADKIVESNDERIVLKYSDRDKNETYAIIKTNSPYDTVVIADTAIDGDDYVYQVWNKETKQYQTIRETIGLPAVDGLNCVTITFDIEDVSYTMTATRRAGPHE